MNLHRRFETNYKNYVMPHIDPTKPINFLEIGVDFGITSRWILDNILTHAESTFHGIDPVSQNIPDDIKKHNQVTLSYTTSIKTLPYCHDNTIDICYIDADHRALCVLMDSVMVWPLMKVGGFIIWDDYLYRWVSVLSPDSPQLRSKEAIDTFIMSVYDCCDVVFVADNQIGIRKTQKYPYHGGAL